MRIEIDGINIQAFVLINGRYHARAIAAAAFLNFSQRRQDAKDKAPRWPMAIAVANSKILKNYSGKRGAH